MPCDDGDRIGLVRCFYSLSNGKIVRNFQKVREKKHGTDSLPEI
jgi:hypothetical protein